MSKGEGGLCARISGLLGCRLSGPSGAAPADAEGDAAAASLSPLEKKLRAVRKKLKQAEALIAKQEAGEPLTQPEKEKVEKAPGW